MRRLLVAAACVAASFAAAQDGPRFSVASIRPSVDNEPGMAVRALPDGGYIGRKVPLMALLTSAFGVSPDRVVGAPGWPDRWDIQARYERTDAAGPVPPLPVLLQSLLRDRFGLVAHSEQRELPVYLLELAARDRRPGPGLKPSRVDCTDPAAAARARAGKLVAGNRAPACDGDEGPGILMAGGLTLDQVARSLRVAAGREVINRTGLAGTWEVTLEFALLGDTGSDKPTVFTAVREQLGLTLQAGTAPLEVLVIDRISRPTGN